jgi:hypothetical protein
VIKQIVRTRNNLSAIWLDGISYQVFKLGGDAAMKWMMKFFSKMIYEKRAPEIWKQARTVLLYKKTDENMLPVRHLHCAHC